MNEYPVPNGPQARILVIDDSPESVALIQARLQRAGYAVSSASNGQAGLEAAMADPPDLILLDIMMPGLDGYEVCRQLKAGETTRAVPVAILTSLVERADKNRAIEVEADDFLSKSVDQTELLARVRSLLRLRGLFHAELARSREETARHSEQLAIERSRADAILRAISCGVLTTDLEGRITSLNPAAEAMTGVRLEAALGRQWREALGIVDRAGRALDESSCPVREVQRTDRPVAARELRIRRLDGREVDVTLAVSPVRRATGSPVELVAVLRDVTALPRA